jgi:hypothetical protein
MHLVLLIAPQSSGALSLRMSVQLPQRHTDSGLCIALDVETSGSVKARQLALLAAPPEVPAARCR